MGSGSRRIVPGWLERVRSCRSGGQWMGMDAHAVRAISRFPAIFVLSGIFRKFLRRETFRHERRIAAHGRLHAPAIVSQLVPASLSVCLCEVSLRRAPAPVNEI